MENKSKSIIIFSLVFFVGIIAGLGIGGYGGVIYGMSSHLLNHCLEKDTKDVIMEVDVLNQLRKGDTAQAIEMLEVHLDDDLIIFDPDKPYDGVTNQTTSEITRAIKKTREYRSLNPRRSNRPSVDAMVANVLKKKTNH